MTSVQGSISRALQIVFRVTLRPHHQPGRAIGLAICLAITPARAQDKYDSLGAAPQHAQPAQRPTRQAAAPGAEPDRRAFELATKLPISDADKNLRDELPADLPLVIQQLGLRMPRGTIVPVSPSPSASEFVDALKHP